VKRSLSERLREAAEPLWRAQLEHPFLRGIGDGTLEPERFRHYLRQDYRFLIDYARVLALACARSPRLELMERFAELTQSTLADEMALHRSYSRQWGVTEAELEREPMTPTTRAYADFLVRTAAAGDYDELLAALLPCMWGYSELGRALAPQLRGDHPYRAWIESYASDQFAALAGWCRDALDGLVADTDADEQRLREPFLVSSRYELAFWDASWRLEPPLSSSGQA
jgi:thiaminase/transcriptional activator TenA